MYFVNLWISTISYANIISTLALLISVSTAAISINNYWNRRPNLKISYNEHTAYSFKAPPTDKNYSKKYRCCMLIQIANKASAPISVSKICIYPDDQPDQPYEVKHFIQAPAKCLIYSSRDLLNKKQITMHIDEQLIPPFCIDARTIKYGFIYLLMDEEKSFSGKLVIETPWKTFSHPIKVSSCQEFTHA